MCFDLDSRPPIIPIAGGALDSSELVLDAADGNRFRAFRARASTANGAGIVILPDVRGLHPYYEELALRFAESGVDALAIDYFGRTAGLGNRVTAATPTAGSVYFYYPRPRRSLPKDWPIRQPGPGWTSIAHYDEAPNPAAWIAHRIGVEHFLPAGIAGKLEREPRAAEAFRVSEATR
jgi:hypothetical protein